MPKFAANLTMLFNELPFLDRFEAASHAGFRGVEYVSPYEYPPAEIAERLSTHGLTQVLFNLPAGDWAAGERGIACHPDRVSEFQEGVGRAISYAKALGCKQVNCLAGIAPQGITGTVLRETFIQSLRFASAALQRHDIQLLIEPINTRDMPGFFLNTSKQAIEIMSAAGSRNLFLQYDIYHMHIMEGVTAKTLTSNLPFIKHVQIADHPGRHEPGTGEIDYRSLLRHLDQLGYSGWVGAEYKPRSTTLAGLNWLKWACT